MTPVYRFAPSPNGLLHLGHAYSALLNFDMARAAGGRFLLRIEDIDTARCTPALEARMLDDLAWLGLEWDGPVRRQSEHFDDYRQALETLADAGMAYRSAKSALSRHMKPGDGSGRAIPMAPRSIPVAFLRTGPPASMTSCGASMSPRASLTSNPHD